MACTCAHPSLGTPSNPAAPRSTDPRCPPSTGLRLASGASDPAPVRLGGGKFAQRPALDPRHLAELVEARFFWLRFSLSSPLRVFRSSFSRLADGAAKLLLKLVQELYQTGPYFSPVLFSRGTTRRPPPPYGHQPLLFVSLFAGDSTHHTRYARPLFPSRCTKLSTQTLI